MFQAKCVLITWTFMALYLFIKSEEHTVVNYYGNI